MEKKKVAVYCGAAFGKDERYKETTIKLGKWIVNQGYNLIYGGGSAGLMGVIADTVLDEGGEVTGVITHFLANREVANPRVKDLYIVETMSERKKIMADHADIFIALPGGPGTLEEITEVISWGILGVHKNPCIFFNFDNYYDNIKKTYDNMVDKGYMEKNARDSILFSDSFEEIENFIKNYKAPELREYNL